MKKASRLITLITIVLLILPSCAVERADDTVLVSFTEISARTIDSSRFDTEENRATTGNDVIPATSDELYWFYKATKKDNLFKVGDTDGEYVALSTATGLNIPVSLSRGDWEFSLKAYSDVTKNPVYEGTTGTVNITSACSVAVPLDYTYASGSGKIRIECAVPVHEIITRTSGEDNSDYTVRATAYFTPLNASTGTPSACDLAVSGKSEGNMVTTSSDVNLTSGLWKVSVTVYIDSASFTVLDETVAIMNGLTTSLTAKDSINFYESTVIKGDSITLGTYSSTPLTWRVIGVDYENDRALLLSDTVLEKDSLAHSVAAGDYSWASSSVRTWMNGTFYTSAFSDTEKSLIAEVAIDTGTETTEDKVFALTADEVKKYLGEANTKRICYAQDGTASAWWTRSLDSTATESVQYIDDRGYTENADPTSQKGVRPALWIKLGDTTDATPTRYTITYNLGRGSLENGVENPSSYTRGSSLDSSFTISNPTFNSDYITFMGWKKEGEDDSTATVNYTVDKTTEENLSLVAVWKEAETITLGTYSGTSLSWIPVKYDYDNRKILLLSEKVLTSMAHQSDTTSSYRWAESNIRTWLNEDFLSSFTTDEKCRILRSTIETLPGGQATGETTEDYIFLIPFEEEYVNCITQEQKKASDLKGNASSWWTSGGDRDSTNHAYFYDSDGYPAASSTTSSYGVRPAMWIAFEDSAYNPSTSYTITYDLNGGAYESGVTYPDSYIRGSIFDSAFSIPDATYNSAYITFAGWKLKGTDDSTAVKNYTIGKNETGDIELVAVWKEAETITLGTYSGSSISWIPITYDYENRKIFLLSEKVLLNMAHMDSTSTLSYYMWSESLIRTWLNGEFLTGSFTDSEKSLILDTTLETLISGTKTKENTEDKIFLVSRSDISGLDTSTTKAVNLSGNATSWWTRDGNEGTETTSSSTDKYVYTFDSDGYGSNISSGTTNRGVRPAMWISFN